MHVVLEYLRYPNTTCLDKTLELSKVTNFLIYSTYN